MRFTTRGLRVFGWLGMAALVVAVLALGPGSGGPPRASAAGLPLRQVDWSAVVRSDPAFTVDPTAYPLPGVAAPYVTVLAPGLVGEPLGGYAMTDDVEYGDLDADGADEAILPIFSGGTGGNLGFVLFREGPAAPRVVLAQSGYKIGAKIVDGRVVISEPHYVGFEANCCPSASTRMTAALRGDRLVALAYEVTPNDVQEPTVWAFYRALSDRNYEDAYAFYSPSLQAQNPFDRWKAGYATTRSIEVETSPGPTPTEVNILLTATDATSGGGAVTRRFRGTWTLVWSPDQKRWLLDRARIEAL